MEAPLIVFDKSSSRFFKVLTNVNRESSSIALGKHPVFKRGLEPSRECRLNKINNLSLRFKGSVS
jgi:hypothetical protein